MENQTYNQEEQNMPNENQGWDEKMFSFSCNDMLFEMYKKPDGEDLLFVLEVFNRIHPEYGHIQDIYFKSLAETSGKWLLEELISFLRNSQSKITLTKHLSHEWTKEISAIILGSGSPPIINGRMFIIAAILQDFYSIFEQLTKNLKWHQQCNDLIDQLDKELTIKEKIDFKSLLTEKGRSLLQNLKQIVSEETIINSIEDTLIDIANLSDIPTDKDSLSRDALAQYLAKRLRHIYNRDIDKGKFGSFFMHIDGAWGSGKSTLLGFIQKHLETEITENDSKEKPLSQKKWLVVNFNAWENQRLDPPWWFLMRSVYHTAMKSKKKISRLKKFILFTNEYLWRLNTGTNYLVAVLLTLGLFIAAIFFRVDSEKKWNELSFVQLVTFIGFLWSLTKFLRTSLVPGSAKAAKTFIEENGKDPLLLLANHFKKQIERIKQPVAIFIDDLDRCNKDYGIKLLEGLQTIFRKAPVVYIVAADRKWLSKMYEDQYSSFANVIAKPAKPFGLVFLDKTFQLTLELPDISAVQKKIYWNDLLNISSDDNTETTKNMKSEMKQKISSASTNQQKMDIAKETTDNPKKQQIAREEAVSSLSIREEEKLIEHTLQKYVDLIEPNPRAMKRLINDISTAKAITYLYNQQVDQEQLILWTILKLEYPLLAEFFWEHPAKISEVEGYTEARKPITDDDSLNTLLLKPEVQKLFRYQLDPSVIELDMGFLDKMQFRV